MLSREENKRGLFPNHPILAIEEAERIRFQNADRLVDYSNQ